MEDADSKQALRGRCTFSETTTRPTTPLQHKPYGAMANMHTTYLEVEFEAIGIILEAPEFL